MHSREERPPQSGASRNVLVVEERPLVASSIVSAVASVPDARYSGTVESAFAAATWCKENADGIVVVGDTAPPLVRRKEVDGQALSAPPPLPAAASPIRSLCLISDIGRLFPSVAILVVPSRPWITEHALSRMLAADVKGCVDVTCTHDELVSAVRMVKRGGSWFGPEVTKLKDHCRSHRTCKGALSTCMLSPREQDIALLVATGYTIEECALALGIAPRTAATHLGRMYEKAGVHN